jgi:DNA-binding transcriptional ArsR family regulator
VTTARVEVLDDPAQVAALGHPLRVALLDALREPDSAAGAARRIGESRQKVNHHVRALVDAGLLEAAGERRKGGFVEQLYRSVASSFMVSSRLACGGDRRVDALRSQLPLEHLVALGERVQEDAIALLDRAAFEGEEIPSLSLLAEVRFPDADARTEFMAEYLELLKPLLKKHGARKGDPYRVALAVYPESEA